MKKIRTYQHAVYANMAVELLKKQGIASVIYGSELSSVDVMPINVGGGINVVVIDEEKLLLAEKLLGEAGL
jgi:hypothetical protein